MVILVKSFLQSLDRLFLDQAHACYLPTIWKNFLANRGLCYVDKW